jgi:hypothetical protein
MASFFTLFLVSFIVPYLPANRCISILRSLAPYTPDLRTYYGIRDLNNKNGSLKPIEYLLQYGADVNVIVPSTPMLNREVKKRYSGYRIFHGTARDMTIDDPLRDPILKKHGGKRTI